jgi:hypothetical protein
MKEHQRIALERGLVEFDRAVAGRRTRRRAIGFAAFVLVAGSAAFVATRAAMRTAVNQPLPSYVEVITSDAQLSNELELASACERIDRREGRVYVVECTRAAAPGATR